MQRWLLGGFFSISLALSQCRQNAQRSRIDGPVTPSALPSTSEKQDSEELYKAKTYPCPKQGPACEATTSARGDLSRLHQGDPSRSAAPLGPCLFPYSVARSPTTSFTSPEALRLLRPSVAPAFPALEATRRYSTGDLLESLPKRGTKPLDHLPELIPGRATIPGPSTARATIPNPLPRSLGASLNDVPNSPEFPLAGLGSAVLTRGKTIRRRRGCPRDRR